MSESKVVHSETIGQWHYRIKQGDGFFTLWRDGARIGRVKGVQMVEFKARTLGDAKKQMRADAAQQVYDKAYWYVAEAGNLLQTLKRLI